MVGGGCRFSGRMDVESGTAGDLAARPVAPAEDGRAAPASRDDQGEMPRLAELPVYPPVGVRKEQAIGATVRDLGRPAGGMGVVPAHFGLVPKVRFLVFVHLLLRVGGEAHRSRGRRAAMAGIRSRT